MTAAWSDMIREAFDLRRAWRTTIPRDAAPADQLRQTDLLVLGLAMRLLEVDVLACPDPVLRPRLAQTWAAAAPATPVRIVEAASDGDHLLLIPPAGLGALREAPVGRRSVLVYGLGAGLPLAAIQMGAPTAVLHPLALASPALWQCGLASVDGSAPSGIDLVAEIARVMRGEWIDPLALLERVQQLTAQLKAVGHADPEAGDSDERVARLERELDLLKRSALVRHHTIVADASRAAGAP